VRELRAIQCPNCKAPLNLLGGGRVQSVTCQYCKSLIDLTKEDRVFTNFKGVEPPTSFFKIGMEGRLFGVCWRLIGQIVYRDRDSNRWSEFLLFSPYFGYAWLVDEGENRLFFSRRIRDLDLRDWARGSSTPRTIRYREKIFFQNEEPYGVFVDYVAGELTWIAKRGDKLYSWDYRYNKETFVNIERTEIEVESYFTIKLDDKRVEKSFKIPKTEYDTCKETNSKKLFGEENKERLDSFFGVSKKTQNDDESPEDKSQNFIVYIFALFVMLFLARLFLLDGKLVLNAKSDTSKTTTSTFEVKSPDRFTHIYINREYGTGFDSVDISLESENGKNIFLIQNAQIKTNKNIPTDYINDITKSIEARLLLPVGKYRLKISSPYSKIETKVFVGELDSGYIDFTLKIFLIYFLFLIITKGAKLPEWFMIAFIISVIIWIIF